MKTRDSSPNISLVLPCRNEAKHLVEIVRRVPDSVSEIIIVNNRSSDSTLKVAQNLARQDKRVIVIDDPRIDSAGVGYGYAHLSGLERATGDIIVGADSDGSYPVEDILKLADFLWSNELDFLSANRQTTNIINRDSLRQLGVSLLNLETRWLYGIKLQDSLSGMWAIRSGVQGQLNLTEGGWNFSLQIKLQAAKIPNIKTGEYPIIQHPRLGKSKQHYVRTGISHALWLAKGGLS